MLADSGSRKRVVVADDNPEMCKFLQRALRDGEAFDVVCVADGEAALEAVERHSADLVLLDLMLPKLSGLEVCRALKARAGTARVAVCIISAMPAHTVGALAKEAGADDFVAKPVDPEEIFFLATLLAERKANADILALAAASLRRLQRDHRNQVRALAHDLRGPLASLAIVLGSRDQPVSSEDHGLLADVARDSMLRLEAMLDSVETAAKLDPEASLRRASGVELSHLLRDVIERLAVTLTLRQLELSLAPRLPECWVSGNAELLRQMITNALLNAIDGSPLGEQLSVSLEGTAADCVLVVQDRGAGIPPQYAREVLESTGSAALRSERVRTGRAQTLCVVNEIAVLHGGSVLLESPASRGLRLTVTLPRRVDESDLSSAAPGGKDPAVSVGLRLLVRELAHAETRTIELGADGGQIVALPGMTAGVRVTCDVCDVPSASCIATVTGIEGRRALLRWESHSEDFGRLLDCLASSAEARQRR